MSRECQVCGKKPRTGNNVSHSNRKTKRRWLPNLQKMKLPVEGLNGKLRLCTGCIKTITRKLVA